MSDKVSVVTIMHGETEFIPLLLHNYENMTNFDNLELVIVDDGSDNLSSFFTDIQNCIYLHLKNEEKDEFIDKIINDYKQPDKSPLQYQKKNRSLPNGFKRDYGCGMSNYSHIFHMNIDCIYNPKSIERKLRFVNKTKTECVYCDTTLCYDIYQKGLYKTESPNKLYESTLFHTREFWKRQGFQWSDIDSEGKSFHYNNGLDRKMDNYYDTIQVLSIHNMNIYNPVKVELENMKINIPELIDTINIEKHPFIKKINQLFDDRITLLGINSEFLTNVTDERWDTYSSPEKWKQTKLSKKIKEFNKEFNVLVFGSKYPAWDLFNHISFDIILLETSKNYEQMCSIILSSKKEEYLKMHGFFVRKSFLE